MSPREPVTDLRGAAERDDRTGPWFDALADGVLVLRRCGRCRHWNRPDTTTCPACHGEDLGWTPAAGTGLVVSRIVDHLGVREGLPPVVLGLVELDEGPWLHARLLDDPHIGDRVALVVLTGEASEPVPAFRAT